MTLTSVLMPVYNAADHLPAAIRSVLDQVGVELELVIVDDGSTDGSAALAHAAAAADPRVRAIAGNHGGVARARNAALSHARGDLITFLDADDLMPPGRFARHAAALAADPSIDAIIGEVLFFRALGADWQPAPGTPSRRAFAVQLGAATFRPNVFATHGAFAPEFAQGEDLDFLLRLIEAKVPMHLETAIAVCYRRHAANMTNDFRAARLGAMRACHKSLVRRRAAGAGLPEHPILTQRHEIEQSLVGTTTEAERA